MSARGKKCVPRTTGKSLSSSISAATASPEQSECDSEISWLRCRVAPYPHDVTSKRTHTHTRKMIYIQCEEDKTNELAESALPAK